MKDMAQEPIDFDEVLICCDEDEISGSELFGPSDAPATNNTNGTALDPKAKEDSKSKDEPMLAELKHLEKRFNSKGEVYVVEQPDEVEPDAVDWWEKYALCVTRQLHSSNRGVPSISLQVNAEPLKKLLKDVIGIYPGMSFYTKNISILFEPRCLFHYRAELLKEGIDQFNNDVEGMKLLILLMNFINNHFKDVIAEGDNLREQGLMSYEHLWTIFKPGCLVHSQVYGQSRVFELLSYTYICGQFPGLRLEAQFTDYDGENLGSRMTNLFIPAFRGAESISSLQVYPLSFNKSFDAAKTALIARGRRFEELAGMGCYSYEGVALEPSGCGVSRYFVNGRIIVDCKTFHRLNANLAWSVNAFDESAKRAVDQSYDAVDLMPCQAAALEPMTDSQALLATATVRGFSLTDKKWCEFFVDQIRPVEWNTDCFDQLVLPDAQKDLVQALVAQHCAAAHGTPHHNAALDDIVKGKGKGLIFVLHGPPGVGKTLTAECVAEYAHRPLFIVSSGDLGTNPSTLDDHLSRILDMASAWRAVLLIDEADVFLEARSPHDLSRNALVSIFLRVLEYYPGMLFMTSNRVATFDEAFKSRIHVPLKYAALPAASRERVWRTFLRRVDPHAHFDDAAYAALGRAPLNGRQIKGVVKTAASLAAFKRRRLDREQLDRVIDMQMEFERELGAGTA